MQLSNWGDGDGEELFERAELSFGKKSRYKLLWTCVRLSVSTQSNLWTLTYTRDLYIIQCDGPSREGKSGRVSEYRDASNVSSLVSAFDPIALTTFNIPLIACHQSQCRTSSN